jgi:imidazolonepropionase
LVDTVDLLLRGAGQLITCKGSGGGKKRGREMDDVSLVNHGAVAVAGGKIVAIGTDEQVSRSIESISPERVIDVGGRVVIPGWVDPHTHVVFSSFRADEYEARLRGEDYLEIGRKGGGIKRTVREVRETKEERLFEISRRRLQRISEQGTTTIEIKSGYGLNLESEMKMLRVINRLERESPLDIVATFLGAHEKPPEYSDRQYVELIIDQMIPAVKEAGLCRFIDVFCEEGVFTLEETRQILEAGKVAGFGLKIHSDEMNALGGTELIADMGGVSADHLVKITDAGIERLARSDTVGVLLPGTTFGLGKKTYAPAREMIDRNVAVAIATDFNPGSAPSNSMFFAVSLACSQMRMTPAEAINAATYNAACAVEMESSVGSLEIGKMADILVCDVEDYREIPSRAGINHAVMVFKEGSKIWEKDGYQESSEVGI